MFQPQQMGGQRAGANWYCNNCRRVNPGRRYQCIHCRGFDTYDLCEFCVQQAPMIHPAHQFRLVQGVSIMPR